MPWARIVAWRAPRDRLDAPAAEEVSEPLWNVRLAEKRGERVVGNTGQGRLRGAAHLRIAVLGQYRQQRDLFLCPGRERSSRSKKAHVPGNFSPLEKIEERTAEPDVHQGAENSETLDSVIRVLTTSPGAPSDLPARPFKV